MHSYRIMVYEFFAAVAICGFAVAVKGGVSPGSLRVGLLISGLFLLVAEVHRQLPQLTSSLARSVASLLPRSHDTVVVPTLLGYELTAKRHLAFETIGAEDTLV